MTITIKGLSKGFATDKGVVPVLDGLDLSLEPGRILMLVGPSGCGKTTLLRIIAGLETADAGGVELSDGAPDSGAPRVGMVFQQYALFPWRTALANIEMGMEMAGVGRDERRGRAMELVEAFGLEGFEDRYPHQLSGGMAQRVALARTLVLRPHLVLMDEPFGSLDSQTRNSLQCFLIKVWSERKDTIIFVTHNVDEAVFLGDEIAVLSRRPARVLQRLTVDLPRPRDRTSGEVNQLRRRVLALLEEQAGTPSSHERE